MQATAKEPPQASRWGTINALLLRSDGTAALECSGVDVLRQELGVTSPESLSVGEQLLLKVAERELPLQVTWRDDGQGHAGNKYGLSTMSDDASLERFLFERSSSSGRAGLLDYSVLSLNGCRARAARYPVGSLAQVRIRTFGTMVEYRFTPDNISRSGMLLWPSRGTEVAPFKENSLLEIKVIPQEKSYSIEGVAKVVRILKHPSDARLVGYGIQLTDFEAEDEKRWLTFIELIEAMSMGRLFQNKVS